MIPDDEAHHDEQKAKWRVIVASLPSGFMLAATMVTNYQQLKTMHIQRRHHKLKNGIFSATGVKSFPIS